MVVLGGEAGVLEAVLLGGELEFWAWFGNCWGEVEVVIVLAAEAEGRVNCEVGETVVTEGGEVVVFVRTEWALKAARKLAKKGGLLGMVGMVVDRGALNVRWQE